MQQAYRRGFRIDCVGVTPQTYIFLTPERRDLSIAMVYSGKNQRARGSDR